jgi:PAS domain S-box-containing protein
MAAHFPSEDRPAHPSGPPTAADAAALPQTLAESQEEFRLLVQSVTDYAIYMLDPSGRIVSWNPGAQRIKGYRREEVIGEHFSRFYTEEDRRAGLPEIALRTAAQEGRFEKEGWRVRKDGTRFWANVVIDPIRHPDGGIRGFAKITRDISERREAQQKLDEAREALSQAQKMEAIGKLTGGVAHDFNNLLSVVIGSLELLQRRIGRQDPALARLVANAMQAAHRGATLTQRMLAFARRQELKPQPIDMRRLVSDMTELLDRSLGPDITLNIRFPPRLGNVVGDAAQLEMAILNLAVNARDAMPGGGTLTVELREEVLGDASAVGLPAGPYAALSMIDHGIGMDEQTLRHAIEPFFTTKGIGKGTGLGLPMVHGLAEQSGGRFVLDSHPGIGTTATLWLPIETAAEAAAPSTGEPAAQPASRPLAVLVVDDDALVLMNTAAMLEDLGHEVTSAHSGREALHRFEQRQRYDLLITDQGMPGMTGLQLIEQARLKAPDMPAILATGYAELPEGPVPDAIRLNKPFLQGALAEAVRRATES